MERHRLKRASLPEIKTLQIHFAFQTISAARFQKNTSTDSLHAALFAADALKPPSGISEDRNTQPAHEGFM